MLIRAGKDIPGRGTTRTWVKAGGWNAQGGSAVTNPCDGIKSLLDRGERVGTIGDGIGHNQEILSQSSELLSDEATPPPRFQGAAS